MRPENHTGAENARGSCFGPVVCVPAAILSLHDFASHKMRVSIGGKPRVSKLLSGLAASALVLAPVSASAATAAAPASKLSVANSARAGSATKNTDRLAGAGILPAILAAAIVAGGIYLVVDDNDDDSDSN